MRHWFSFISFRKGLGGGINWVGSCSFTTYCLSDSEYGQYQDLDSTQCLYLKRGFLIYPGMINIKFTSVVVSFQVNPAVKISCPISGELLFLFDAPDKVIHMLFPDVFNSKIVDY